jgi:hypothetical protein
VENPFKLEDIGGSNLVGKNGDFVTAMVYLPEEHPVRQGILDGDLLHGESGATYKIVKVYAVVEKLYGSTLEFYNNYHFALATNTCVGRIR